MAKVNIKGVIVSDDEKWVYDWFGMEATSPKSVNKEIDAASGGDLDVEINSGGGSVFAGSEIYTALKSYAGNVTVKIVGVAASAASVIAMAGKRVLMSPTAQMMIHNVSSWQSGDHRDMEHMAGVLRGADETVANAYMLKSGMSKEELLGMMGKETWLTPEKALGKKLIDEIMFRQEIKLVASLGNTLPPEVIDKIRGLKSPTYEPDFLMQKAQAQIKILKLKGER